MKVLFFSMFLVLAGYSYSQSSIFKGKILLEDSFSVNDGFVVFPLKGDTIHIGKSGVASVDLTKESNRVFFFQWMDWKSKIYRVNETGIQSKIFKVAIPDIKFYENFQAKRLCPVCIKNISVIPIIYGLPSERDFQDANEGKIYLGGCDIMENQPKFYCRNDKFSF